MPTTLAFRPVTAVLVGAAAGLTAAFAMNRFQAAWAAVSSPGGRDDGSAKRTPPATEQAADDLVWLATGRRLDPAARKPAGSAVHYGFGAILGAAYGLLRGGAGRFGPGRGAAFGIAAALVVDEGAVPLLGWSDAPDRTPWSLHAYGWLSHIVFGVTLEVARRALGKSAEALTGGRQSNDDGSPPGDP